MRCEFEVTRQELTQASWLVSHMLVGTSWHLGAKFGVVYHTDIDDRDNVNNNNVIREYAIPRRGTLKNTPCPWVVYSNVGMPKSSSAFNVLTAVWCNCRDARIC